MSPRLFELLDLAARWVHVIAAIMWVGNSLLFNWLDRTLSPPSRRGAGLQGESWLLHSGGFYLVEKTQLVGQRLPATLHWFKWQAYITWISGAVLLLVVYYLGGRAAMADPGVAPLGNGAAAAVGVGAIVLGVLVYELTQRYLAPRAPAVATAILLLAFVAVVYALTHLLNGRAAFLHVGAMLGTIMAGNVAMTIVPSQRDLVRSVAEGGRAEPSIAERAKRVSITNNYLTFPVIALMLSGHVPSMYAHRWSWVVLLVIVALGALVRHLMNVRFSMRRWRSALAATIALGGVTLYALLRVAAAHDADATTAAARGLPVHVSFAEARHVIDRRCGACHSAQPSDSSIGAAPAGVMLDQPEQIRLHAARIRERAVVSRTMPPANKTRITDRERALLGRWIEQGATIP